MNKMNEKVLVVELQGIEPQNAEKVLNLIREMLKTDKIIALLGLPLPICHGFLFDETPAYDPLPFREFLAETATE